jgi:hypothetical protein
MQMRNEDHLHQLQRPKLTKKKNNKTMKSLNKLAIITTAFIMLTAAVAHAQNTQVQCPAGYTPVNGSCFLDAVVPAVIAEQQRPAAGQAKIQPAQQQPDHQCPTGQTWVKAIWGGACYLDEHVPSVMAAIQEQQRLAEIQAKQDALHAAKADKSVQVQVVGTEASVREYSYYIPGTNGYSTTNCNANATAATYGDITTANGTGTCYTTSTPGRPASISIGSIRQSNVHAIMADGTHVTLWCQNGFRHCADLAPGYYQAEIAGNSLWMFAHEFGGKEHKMKYHVTGTW